MTLDPSPTPFQTDAQLAQRIRLVEGRLRHREPSLARELAEIARVLNPDTTAAVADPGPLELFDAGGAR